MKIGQALAQSEGEIVLLLLLLLLLFVEDVWALLYTQVMT
jgi:hypothetical protein